MVVVQTTGEAAVRVMVVMDMVVIKEVMVVVVEVGEPHHQQLVVMVADKVVAMAVVMVVHEIVLPHLQLVVTVVGQMLVMEVVVKEVMVADRQGAVAMAAEHHLLVVVVTVEVKLIMVVVMEAVVVAMEVELVVAVAHLLEVAAPLMAGVKEEATEVVMGDHRQLKLQVEVEVTGTERPSMISNYLPVCRFSKALTRYLGLGSEHKITSRT